MKMVQTELDEEEVAEKQSISVNEVFIDTSAFYIL
jgi:hypothetical protein